MNLSAELLASLARRGLPVPAEPYAPGKRYRLPPKVSLAELSRTDSVARRREQKARKARERKRGPGAVAMRAGRPRKV